MQEEIINPNDEKKDESSNEELDGKTKSVGRKRKIFLNLLKVLIIAAIAGGIFYVIYFTSNVKKADLILSLSEITSQDISGSNEFNSNDLVYFLVYTEQPSFNASILDLKIEIKSGEEYIHYRKVTYEIETTESSFNSTIPRSYMKKKGLYKISIIINGEVIASKDIVIK